MTKTKALKSIESLIEKIKKAGDEINEVIQKNDKNPRITDTLGMVYGDLVRNLTCLASLKNDIERIGENDIERARALLGDLPIHEEGFYFDEEEEGKE